MTVQRPTITMVEGRNVDEGHGSFWADRLNGLGYNVLRLSPNMSPDVKRSIVEAAVAGLVVVNTREDGTSLDIENAGTVRYSQTFEPPLPVYITGDRTPRDVELFARDEITFLDIASLATGNTIEER